MHADRLLIFDFDGVIVNTFDMCFSISQILNPFLSKNEYRGHFEGNIFEAAGKKKNMANTDFSSHYGAKIGNHRPEDAMPEVLRSLHQTYPMIIVSSTHSDHIRSFLEAHELSDCFSMILGSDVDRSKVVKITHALKDTSTNPQNAIMITDTVGDMREAAECGVRSIGVSWGYHEAERLEKGAPIAIATTPHAIQEIITNYFEKPPRIISR